MRGAIWSAYEAADNALERPCASSGAEPQKWCNLPDDRVRRVPCVSRCKNGTTWAPDTCVVAEAPHARDYSEPLYSAEEP